MVCESLEAHSLRLQKECSPTLLGNKIESMNLVVLYLDPGCE